MPDVKYNTLRLRCCATDRRLYAVGYPPCGVCKQYEGGDYCRNGMLVKIDVRRVYFRAGHGGSSVNPSFSPMSDHMHAISHIVAPKVGPGDLGSDEGRRYGVWSEEKGRDGSIEIYTTCIGCGGVNKISTNRVSPLGISECFRCKRCDFVSRVILEGWEDHRPEPVVFL